MSAAVPVVVMLLAVATVAAQERTRDATAHQPTHEFAPLDRSVDRHVTLKLPVDPCTVPDIVSFLGKWLDVPVGVEYLPGKCVYGPGRSQPVEEIPLIARTFRDVLDLLVKVDSRFYWTETDGVVVIRPLEAWTRREHFLHETIAGLDLEDANIGGAIDAVFRGKFGAPSSGAQIMSADPSAITLRTGPLSVVEALDAVVRAHGRARWEVKYCLPEIRADVATASIFTYDDRGVGRPVGPRPRDAQGRVINPCLAP